MNGARRPRGGLAVPTLLAAAASGAAVLVTVLTAGAAVTPNAGPEVPVVPVVRPPQGVDLPPLPATAP
jgi:hypothetical protein